MDRAPEEPSGTAIPAPGEILDGKYRIERSIGQGAMATVLEATHLRLDDHVAIKVLLPQWAEDAELVERFLREGRAATRIRSEHVVRVFDVGVAPHRPYLVMEYLHGRDLDRLLAEEGPLAPSLAVEYLLQALEAIAEAHVLGVIHRDLKPANLFLTRRADGSACIKVLDFGISKVAPSATIDAKATQPQAVLGSPHYMSPEQMQSSRDVDVRSDIWALGAILHELVAGKPAFDAETLPALSAMILRDPPPPLSSVRADVPPALEAAVLRCFEKDPARRFANVAELAWALAELGGPAAHASAERIARVLEAGPAAISVPRPPLPTPQAEVEARPLRAMLDAPSIPPPRARSRMFGYVVGFVALSGVAIGVGSMIVKHQHAVRDAEAREEAEKEAASASASASTQAPPPPLPTMSCAPPTMTSAVASAAAVASPAHATAPSAPKIARPTHVPPRPPPRKGAKRPGPNDPLPDFPVPPVPASEQGEPK